MRLKVTAAVTLVLLSIALLVGLALVRYQRFHLEVEADKRARSLARTLAFASRDPLLMGDVLRLGPTIQAMLEDPDIRYAFVIDHRGTIAYHSNTQLIGKSRGFGRPDGPLALEASVPIVVEEAVVGRAVVGLDDAFIDAAVRTTGFGLLTRLAAWTAIGLGVLLLLTGRHVRRIEDLGSAVRALGGGDLEARVHLAGRDELGEVAAAFNAMVGELREARAEVEQGVTDTVRALASTIEANDPYTHGHCRRVGSGTRATAERLGLDVGAVRHAELAGILHDIGKIGVATGILSKAGPLTEPEVLAMQQHPVIGARILESVSFFGEVARDVRHHHEDWDGGGYPDGLEGDTIPVAARIIHVVDAFDAMTSSRPYRDELPRQEALRRLRAGRAGQFDPEVVDAFVEMVEEGVVAAIRRQVDEGEA